MGDPTDDDLPLPIATYLRLRGLEAPRRSRRRKRVDIADEHAPFAPGRDPKGLGDVLASLTREAGWDTHLAEEDLLLQWQQIAGEQTAAHSEPIGLREGVLTVRCDSTAWTKQLTLLRGEIMTRIIRDHPQVGVKSIRFVGPDVPSWKWGTRAVPGRGPRDTYG